MGAINRVGTEALEYRGFTAKVASATRGKIIAQASRDKVVVADLDLDMITSPPHLAVLPRPQAETYEPLTEQTGRAAQRIEKAVLSSQFSVLSRRIYLFAGN